MKLRLLRVDLSARNSEVEELDQSVIEKYVGGRGLSSKLIWDEVEKGTDPLGPGNKLVMAGGPLTGLPVPSSGKMVMAAKSPHTMGYGDGNIGTQASVQLRKTGHDAVLFEGISEDPVWVHVDDDEVVFKDASDLWGKDTYQKEDMLYEKAGKNIGAVMIGPAGENLVKYATIMSERGRAGGRTGMGAVMGSKKLAAVSFNGTQTPYMEDEQRLRDMAGDAYQEISDSEDYNFWMRQGTMLAVQLCNTNSTLPVRNFSEGIFEDAERVDGKAMESMKEGKKGCPNCNMQCGNMIMDAEDEEIELDYENVAMLGPNLGIGNLRQVGVLNKLCDQYGLDTISGGSSVAFAMEAAQKGLIEEDIEFGDYEGAKQLLEDISLRRGIGDQLAEGTKRTAKQWGNESEGWAMQIKNLEISAYNCYSLPGMALAFGTSPIGGHHKDSWVIAWELENDRSSYSDGKIEEILNQQRKRGGAFESFTTCRLPWIEVGFNLDWYEKMFEAATGISQTWDDFDQLGDRIYALVRSIFAREYGKNWSNAMDVPPDRWFDEELTEGEHAGASLDRERFMDMLKRYYDRRGWTDQGVPSSETLKELGLDFVIPELEENFDL
ncbi:aldehyde ferredoxin oxidoreductase family protein [Candidatus Bipolaricaulota bacterium]|nr:aldehyde ferredoxin oxidoreductase family protein [Candidatus Bipolaricaulota bacterium]